MSRGVKRVWAASAALLLVSACSGTSANTASPDASSTAQATLGPVVGPHAPTAGPTAGRAAGPDHATLGSYEKRVLADGAVAVYPLAAVSPAGSEGFGPGRRLRATLQHAVPPATSGPVLAGTARKALRFTGAGRLITGWSTGFSAQDTWTVEMWVRADGCSRMYERLGGNSTVSPAGREGLDLLHYPAQADAPCRFGAELWARGSYLGGCSSGPRPVLGRWRHWAVTYTPGLLRCYVDGHLQGIAHARVRRQAATALFGIGGSGNGFNAGLATASLADVALYHRRLTSEVLGAHASLRR